MSLPLFGRQSIYLIISRMGCAPVHLNKIFVPSNTSCSPKYPMMLWFLAIFCNEFLEKGNRKKINRLIKTHKWLQQIRWNFSLPSIPSAIVTKSGHLEKSKNREKTLLVILGVLFPAGTIFSLGLSETNTLFLGLVILCEFFHLENIKIGIEPT